VRERNVRVQGGTSLRVPAEQTLLASNRYWSTIHDILLCYGRGTESTPCALGFQPALVQHLHSIT